ncbi:hypothetical protein FB004_13811 [Sinorhizobium medicae]|nr:hypothetical protein FB006_1626 [Sinorhizobium medicae]TWA12791.1 hypothetical protein FB004_13811 [Sinorhizobium medicae]TWA22247.1 hypothetical protein FB007_1607 [Sinorhizobium medicae]TWA31107.1 hypothetical protein FB009_13920 [Sinorhizobium medicae]TWA32778.1 hypothetical protein FB005_15910 [Sinorhizobium medicae]
MDKTVPPGAAIFDCINRVQHVNGSVCEFERSDAGPLLVEREGAFFASKNR